MTKPARMNYYKRLDICNPVSDNQIAPAFEEPEIQSLEFYKGDQPNNKEGDIKEDDDKEDDSNEDDDKEYNSYEDDDKEDNSNEDNYKEGGRNEDDDKEDEYYVDDNEEDDSNEDEEDEYYNPFAPTRRGVTSSDYFRRMMSDIHDSDSDSDSRSEGGIYDGYDDWENYWDSVYG